MPSKTRDQLRALVRTQVDMDATELPDTLLDTWLDDGYDRTLAFEDRWPFLEAAWTFTTVANQEGYVKATLNAAHASLAQIDKISSVMDLTTYETNSLTYMPYATAEIVFGTGNNASAVPAFWSEWADSVWLWDSPVAGRTIRVRGFRKGVWAAPNATVVDADERLHLPIYLFGVAMVYAQQEDDVLSSLYMRQWQDAVQQAHARIMTKPSRSPLVMSGGTYSTVPQ